jgi:hypothetical protein
MRRDTEPQDPPPGGHNQKGRLFSSSRSFKPLELLSLWSTELLPHAVVSHFTHPICRIAYAIDWPCDTTTSTCRNFATIFSDFLAICSPL